MLGQPGEHFCHANQYSSTGVLKSSRGPGATYELVSRDFEVRRATCHAMPICDDIDATML